MRKIKRSPSSIGTHIKVKNLHNSLNFYERFSLKPIFVYGGKEHLARFSDVPGAPEKYNGVIFGIGNGMLEIADGHSAVKPEVFKQDVKSSKISIYLDVESVDEVRQVAVDNNLDIAVDIKEYPWGKREIVLRDPDGMVVVFRSSAIDNVKQGAA